MSNEWVSAADAIWYVRAVLACSHERACLEIAERAAEGKLRAFGPRGTVAFAIGGGDDPSPVDEEEEIPASAWRENISTKWNGLGAATYFTVFRFERDPLLALFPLAGAATVEASAEAAPKAQGGRLVQKDWDRIVSEVIRRIHEEGVPARIEPFADKVLEWCDRSLPASRVPGKSILTRRLKTWLASVRHEAEPG